MHTRQKAQRRGSFGKPAPADRTPERIRSANGNGGIEINDRDYRPYGLPDNYDNRFHRGTFWYRRRRQMQQFSGCETCQHADHHAADERKENEPKNVAPVPTYAKVRAHFGGRGSLAGGSGPLRRQRCVRFGGTQLRSCRGPEGSGAAGRLTPESCACSSRANPRAFCESGLRVSSRSGCGIFAYRKFERGYRSDAQVSGPLPSSPCPRGP